jgi:RNA ligase (TIGR02306 family)
MLAGSKGDRVKAVRLRGEFSLGICIPTIRVELANQIEYFLDNVTDEIQNRYTIVEGQDVSNILGVTKYEPPIPTCLSGEVYNAGTQLTLDYDVENIKNYPDIIVVDEYVQVTEKLHGTLCCITYVPIDGPYASEDHLTVEVNNVSGQFAVSSKGLGSKGLCFKWNEANKNNLYQLNANKYLHRILEHAAKTGLKDRVIMIYGEVFGNGVQDLHYGMKQGQTDIRVFDIYVGVRGQGFFLDDMLLDNWCESIQISRVPVLFRGHFNRAEIERLCQNAKSTFDEKQILEGVVIKSQFERTNTPIGRACVKLINEQYLLRKNGTELN